MTVDRFIVYSVDRRTVLVTGACPIPCQIGEEIVQEVLFRGICHSRGNVRTPSESNVNDTRQKYSKLINTEVDYKLTFSLAVLSDEMFRGSGNTVHIHQYRNTVGK